MRRAVSVRVSPHRAFVDVAPDYRQSLYVAGSRRSGTSWLAEMLAERYVCRFVLEPFRADRVPGARWFTYGRYLSPDADAPDVEAFVRRVLSGRVRSVWSDRENAVRVARRRVVKDVWQNPLVPWMAGRFPDMPVVYILRHPLACASSAASMSWDLFFDALLQEKELFGGPLRDVAPMVGELVEHADPLVPHVLRWCIENATLVRLLDAERVHVVFFEDLVSDAPRELRRIDNYVAAYGARRWRARRQAPHSLGRASLSDYRQSDREAAGADRLTMWQRDLSQETRESCMAVVDAFGLGRIYGPGTHPQISPDLVLARR